MNSLNRLEMDRLKKIKLPRKGECFRVDSKGILKSTSCNKYNRWKMGIVLEEYESELVVLIFPKCSKVNFPFMSSEMIVGIKSG